MLFGTQKFVAQPSNTAIWKLYNTFIRCVLVLHYLFIVQRLPLITGKYLFCNGFVVKILRVPGMQPLVLMLPRMVICTFCSGSVAKILLVPGTLERALKLPRMVICIFCSGSVARILLVLGTMPLAMRHVTATNLTCCDGCGRRTRLVLGESLTSLQFFNTYKFIIAIFIIIIDCMYYYIITRSITKSYICFPEAIQNDKTPPTTS
jgi:hypothetical protein